MATRNEDIDYEAEGANPPREKDDPTNAGYDEAARTGPGRYGVGEGDGGVFGTTGGGTFDGGMHEVEREVIGTGEVEDRARNAEHPKRNPNTEH